MLWINGYYIWYNESRHKWLVQSGYEILKEYKHLGHAKNYANKH